MKRLYNLDYLRGLSAFGIMIYHYLTWTLGNFSSDTFMARLGLYGVSIFYVLSGLTLYHVYYHKMKPSKDDVLSFFKKRAFRIFPLLWLVTIVSIMLSRKMPDFTDLFLNLSGIFGFVKWDKSFALGAWSIGNELVFYVFFPFFMLFIKRFKPLMIALSLAIFALYLYFPLVALSPSLTLSEQWANYVNPLNQVFLFLGGFLIGFFLQDIKINSAIIITLLLSGIALFIFYPTSGSAISLVTGINRLIFTTCCFVICICFYKLTLKLPVLIHKPLTLLGEASYSVYLLHPIIWKFVGMASGIFRRHIFYVPERVSMILAVTLTLIASYYVYHYFEKYFMKLGQTNKDKPLKPALYNL